MLRTRASVLGLLLLPLTLPLSLSACAEGDLSVSGTTLSASAGVDRSVVAGSPVSLDASQSRDPARRPLTYRWSLDERPATSSAALAAVEAVVATFTPDIVGVYRASVRVSNGTSAASAQVTLTAVPSGGDLTPPAVTLTTVPPILSNSASASFSFISSKPASRFQCALDAEAAQACTSPRPQAGLSDGPHTFTVHAVDAAGNAALAPATHHWTIDTVAPDTALLTAPPALTSATTAAFTFSASEPSTFRCALDGAPAADCASGASFGPLGEGAHTFAVTAVDLAGNADPTPAVARWTVDSRAPDVALTSTPEARSRNAIAVFTFAGHGARYECALDEGAGLPCASPFAAGPLAEGGHSFQVVAVSATGARSTAPARYLWTVDTTPPHTLLLSAPDALTSNPTATFTFSSNEPGGAFLCALDETPAAPCLSPYIEEALGDGIHHVTLTAIDAAGNAEPEPTLVIWTVDTMAPDTFIVWGPNVTTPNSTASFTFASSEAGCSFYCLLDAPASATPQPCTSPASFGPLAPGAHQLRVFAVDAAGNADATPATYAWQVVPRPIIGYPAAPLVLHRGVAIAAITPSSTGGTPTSFVSVPALPAGLVLQAVTGTVSGTPTVVTPAAQYLITASNASGSVSYTLTISVVDAVPTIAYGGGPFTFTRNSVIAAVNPSLGGGPVTAWSVQPPLPAGLVLDGANGTLAGAPVLVTPRTSYAVTASNSGGSAQAVLSIAVNDAPPNRLAYTANPASYLRGLEIANNVPVYQGGAATAFAVVPPLPAGLTLDPQTGVISGTPGTQAAMAAYVITASNSGGATTVALRLGIASPCASFNLPFGHGDGTVGNPYLICTRQHLESVSTAIDKNFRLENDLDLGAAPLTPLGTSAPAMPTGQPDPNDVLAFQGTFDGDGHTLSNFRFNVFNYELSDLPVALFRHVGQRGTVQNLNLRNVNLVGKSIAAGVAGFNEGAIRDVTVSGSIVCDSTAGGVVGQQQSPASVTRATMTGTVRSNATGPRTGTTCDTAAAGVVGISYGGSVTDCHSSGSVTWATGPGTKQIAAWTWSGGVVGYGSPDIRGCSSSATVSGGFYTGGVAGGLESGVSVLDDSFSTGDITGVSGVGGVVGLNGNIMHRCYATGKVTGDVNVGGLVGFNRIPGVASGVFNSFATGAVTGRVNVGGLIGIFARFGNPALQMSVENSYATGTVTLTGTTPDSGGGLIGLQQLGDVRSSYAANTVVAAAGSTNVNAFVGRQTAGTLCGNYVLVPADSAGQIQPPGVTELSPQQFVDALSFENLSFTGGVWAMATANPFSPAPGNLVGPVLSWQCGQHEVVCGTYAASAPQCVIP